MNPEIWRENKCWLQWILLLSIFEGILSLHLRILSSLYRLLIGKKSKKINFIFSQTLQQKKIWVQGVTRMLISPTNCYFALLLLCLCPHSPGTQSLSLLWDWFLGTRRHTSLWHLEDIMVLFHPRWNLWHFLLKILALHPDCRASSVITLLALITIRRYFFSHCLVFNWFS